MQKIIKSPLYLGAFLMMLGMFSLASANAVLKATAPSLDINQILFVRGLWGLGFLALILPFQGGLRALQTKKLGLQSFRGIIGYCSLFCIFLSFKLLPMADATAIQFGMVLIVSFASPFFFKEVITKEGYALIVLGFIGIAIIAQPTGNVQLWGATVAFGGALFEGLVLLTSKMLGPDEKPITSTLYHTLFNTLCAFVFVSFDTLTLDLTQNLMIGALASLGMIGQMLVVKAYHYAPASKISPLIYTTIIWAVLYGALIWGEHPTWHFYVGASVVILSGVRILRAS